MPQKKSEIAFKSALPRGVGLTFALNLGSCLKSVVYINAGPKPVEINMR